MEFLNPIPNDKPWIRLIGIYTFHDGRRLGLSLTCTECKEVHTFTVKEEDLDKWKGGELIQRCFTTLDENDRELFISGICGKCFDKLFEVDNE